jgi:hypothetical protein
MSLRGRCASGTSVRRKEDRKEGRGEEGETRGAEGEDRKKREGEKGEEGEQREKRMDLKERGELGLRIQD